jgi:luciferase family oxidoreductase group 1
VLMTRIAAETSRIRVGSGAVLLPHYSPLKVAEVFRMLHALYPNRIDLGIGRAAGGTQLEARALRRDRGTAPMADDFPDRLIELEAFLGNGFPADHPFSKIRVTPEMPGAPQLWLLGSSEWSASAAAQLGLRYAFAHFIDPQYTRAAIEQYRAGFTPSEYVREPRLILALGVVCADTEWEAQRLALSSRALLRRFRTFPRNPGLVPTPEEAELELASGLNPSMFETGEWARYAIGSPESVRAQLDQITRELQVDELMVVTIVHDHQARLRSYELLAQAFNLQPSR